MSRLTPALGILSILTITFAIGANRLTSQLPEDSAKAPAEECEMQIVEGMIKQCCKVPYSIYFNCKDFSQAFVDLCAENKLSGCRKIGIDCSEKGHVIVEMIIDGKLCLVAPQGRVISCDVDAPEKYHAAICDAMGKPEGCECTSGPFNYISSNYGICAQTTSRQDGNFVEKCDACCEEFAAGYKQEPLTDAWKKDCSNTCAAAGTAVACEVQGNCSKGYMPNTCDPVTCTQKYNTGLCTPGSSTCTVIRMHCQHPFRDCNDPGRVAPHGTPLCKGAGAECTYDASPAVSCLDKNIYSLANEICCEGGMIQSGKRCLPSCRSEGEACGDVTREEFTECYDSGKKSADREACCFDGMMHRQKCPDRPSPGLFGSGSPPPAPPSSDLQQKSSWFDWLRFW